MLLFAKNYIKFIAIIHYIHLLQINPITMNLRTLLLSTFMIICLTAWSQSLPRQVLASGGKISVAGNISLSWTVGQPSPVASYSTSSLKLTQGFQQGDEWWVSIDGKITAYTDIKVYPNPSTGKFNLAGKLPATGQCRYMVTDALGNLVLEGEFTPGTDGDILTWIELAPNPPGLYVLKLQGGDGIQKYVCSFKLTLLQQK